MKNKILIGLLLALLTYSCLHFLNRKDSGSYPKTTNSVINSGFHSAIGFVNDFENIIENTDEIELTRIIQSHENTTGNQIAIVTIDTLFNHENFYQYTLGLANYWGVGEKDKNNGILFAVSKKLKEIRIQVGDGLLEKLTNNETQAIVDSVIIPEFKIGNYFEGIQAGLRNIIKEIE